MSLKKQLVLVLVCGLLAIAVLPWLVPSFTSRIIYQNVDESFIEHVCGQVEVKQASANLTTSANVLFVDEQNYTYWNGSPLSYKKQCTLLTAKNGGLQ